MNETEEVEFIASGTNLHEHYHILFRHCHPSSPQHYRRPVSIGCIWFDRIGTPNLSKAHCRLRYRFFDDDKNIYIFFFDRR